MNLGELLSQSNLPSIILLVGVILIAIAAVGGGLKISVVSIPQVRAASRLATFGAGIFCVALSLFLLQDPTGRTTPSAPVQVAAPTNSASQAPVALSLPSTGHPGPQAGVPEGLVPTAPSDGETVREQEQKQQRDIQQKQAAGQDTLQYMVAVAAIGRECEAWNTTYSADVRRQYFQQKRFAELFDLSINAVSCYQRLRKVTFSSRTDPAAIKVIYDLLHNIEAIEDARRRIYQNAGNQEKYRQSGRPVPGNMIQEFRDAVADEKTYAGKADQTRMEADSLKVHLIQTYPEIDWNGVP